MPLDATESVTIITNNTVPVSYTVEVLDTDGDGGIDITIFSGPKAEKRAREYARWKYRPVGMIDVRP